MCEAQFLEYFVEERTKVLASVSKHASISRMKAPCSELTTMGAGQSQKTKNICRQNSSKRRKWGRFQQAKILQLTLIDGEEEGVKQKQAELRGENSELKKMQIANPIC